MRIGHPWGLQCKRAGTGWALVHGHQWTQDPFPHAPGLEPTGGVMVPGRARGQSQGAVMAARTTEGTIRGVWEVEGQSPSRLGRHIDVPERDGAAGGLVPEQQGWRVWVRVCLSTAQLCAGLSTGLRTGA